MHKIGEYTFDSERLIMYKSDIDKKFLNDIASALPVDAKYEGVISELMRQTVTGTHLGRIAINSIGICTTNNCNLRCNYCGFSSTERDKSKLPLQDIEAFIKDAIRKRTIRKLITKQNEPFIVYFTGGGEPTYEWDTLRKAVLFLKRQCSDNDVPLKLSMTTNGVLTNEQIDFISQNFTRLMISYDGLPEVQNSNRVSPKIKNTNSKVEYSIKEFSKRGLPIEIRTTIWQDDYSRMIDMYNHVFSLVASDSDVTWSIYPILFEGRAVERIKHQEDKTYEQFINSYFDMIEYIRNEKGEEKISSVGCPLFGNNSISLFCGSLCGDEPFLQPDGSIITCNESKDYSVCIGRVIEGRVEYFNDYDNTFLKIAREKYVECRGCIAYRFCRGGCPIWHLREVVDENGPLECQATKAYWQYILEAMITNKYSFGWRLEKMDLPDIEHHEIYQILKKSPNEI